jgi:hypothetical protein
VNAFTDNPRGWIAAPARIGGALGWRWRGFALSERQTTAIRACVTVKPIARKR